MYNVSFIIGYMFGKQMLNYMKPDWHQEICRSPECEQSQYELAQTKIKSKIIIWWVINKGIENTEKI